LVGEEEVESGGEDAAVFRVLVSPNSDLIESPFFVRFAVVCEEEKSRNRFLREG
jgi:hypothetical protein